ncbi:MAG TPA: DUF4282 domain-containing protein [Streptosporangiaceae bacterium]|nr:DUF4282 domain-containing protein [Streptosporangiaceae bacterium]
MTDQGYGQGQPDYGQAQGQGQGQGAGYPGQGAAYPGPGAGYGAPMQDASAKGFVSSLFDFGFNSFVTPKVVKVVYVLITALLGLGVIAFIISAFASSVLFGIITLFILAPLFFFVYLALWRIGLEIFIVIFRMADDIRAIRNSGGGLR